MIKQNLLDKLIAYVSPEMGRARMQNRGMMALTGSYVGATLDSRASKMWQTTPASADGNVLPDLYELRERSRDLLRNNPLAVGAVATVVTNVVGTGLKLKAQPDGAQLGMSDDESVAWAATVESEFALWAESQNCDVTRTLNFYGLQELAFRAVLESGDVLALLPMRLFQGDTYSTKVQLVEADQLVNKDYTIDTVNLAGGVQMDDGGAPVAYHVLKYHPFSYKVGELQRTWNIIPAFGSRTGRRNVIHLFRRTRPGQNRGVPYLTPVIEPLKQLGRYTDAEIMAAVISGMFTVFVKSEAGDGLSPMVATGVSDAPDSDIRLGNGAIVDLRQGESIDTANPGRPNTAFDPFVQAILRQIGVALELPFEILIKHFTASYSAARAALLEAWRFFNNRRQWLARNFCQVVYETWMEEAISMGRVSAPGFFSDPARRRAYLCATWYGDSPGQIDPVKEVTAAQLRVNMGVSNLAAETAALTGGDWDSNHKEQVREHNMRIKDGLIPDPAAQELDQTSQQTNENGKTGPYPDN